MYNSMHSDVALLRIITSVTPTSGAAQSRAVADVR